MDEELEKLVRLIELYISAEEEFPMSYWHHDEDFAAFMSHVLK